MEWDFDVWALVIPAIINVTAIVAAAIGVIWATRRADKANEHAETANKYAAEQNQITLLSLAVTAQANQHASEQNQTALEALRIAENSLTVQHEQYELQRQQDERRLQANPQLIARVSPPDWAITLICINKGDYTAYDFDIQLNSRSEKYPRASLMYFHPNKGSIDLAPKTVQHKSVSFEKWATQIVRHHGRTLEGDPETERRVYLESIMRNIPSLGYASIGWVDGTGVHRRYFLLHITPDSDERNIWPRLILEEVDRDSWRGGLHPPLDP